MPGSQLWTTGPAHAFIGQVLINLAGNVTFGSAFYLGTCEESPEIQLIPKYKEVYNDIGGEQPFDTSFQGEIGLINLDLNRFDEAVYARMATRPYSAGQPVLPVARGTQGYGSVGALTLTEGLYTTVWIQFPYASKPAFAGMPAGYRFFSAFAAGPDKLRPVGTRTRKTNVTFVALRYYVPSSQAMILYDHNMNGLPKPT